MRFVLCVAAALLAGITAAPAQMAGGRMIIAGASTTGGGSPGCPSAPTEASEAGFTTCAANFDFTGATAATLGATTYTLSPVSNWLDCNNSNPAVPWHDGSPGYYGNIPSCGNIFLTTDGGTQVLDIQYLNSFSSYGYSDNRNNVSMQTVMNGGSGTVTASFPTMYLEMVYRLQVPNGTTTNQQAGPSGPWVWQAVAAGGCTPNCAIETDPFELYYSNSAGSYGDSGWANHRGPASNPAYAGYIVTSWGANHLPAGWASTAYHTYGELLTSDGSTHIYVCGWVDHILQGCQDTNALTPQYTQRNTLIAWAGGPVISGAWPPNQNLLIQYIRVYSCASLATTMCNGSTLSNSGGSNPLIYWH